MYPLVRELAVDGIPVTVTCRVLKLARQPYYRWLDAPVTDAELSAAYRANALFDAHRDDPEFGYRFLRRRGRATPARRWPSGPRGAICSDSRLVVRVRQEERPRKGKKPGPPVHDDLWVTTSTA